VRLDRREYVVVILRPADDLELFPRQFTRWQDHPQRRPIMAAKLALLKPMERLAGALDRRTDRRDHLPPVVIERMVADFLPDVGRRHAHGGSPPRAWGISRATRGRGRGRRFTPTRVGKL
jgi:hypothetical protein